MSRCLFSLLTVTLAFAGSAWAQAPIYQPHDHFGVSGDPAPFVHMQQANCRCEGDTGAHLWANYCEEKAMARQVAFLRRCKDCNVGGCATGSCSDAPGCSRGCSQACDNCTAPPACGCESQCRQRKRFNPLCGLQLLHNMFKPRCRCKGGCTSGCSGGCSDSCGCTSGCTSGGQGRDGQLPPPPVGGPPQPPSLEEGPPPPPDETVNPFTDDFSMGRLRQLKR